MNERKIEIFLLSGIAFFSSIILFLAGKLLASLFLTGLSGEAFLVLPAGLLCALLASLVLFVALSETRFFLERK